MSYGGPQESKTGRSVPSFWGSKECSDISLFQKIAKLSLEAAILEWEKNYFKIRPLNRSRMPCNMCGVIARLQDLAALQFQNLFTECSQIVFAINFNNNFYHLLWYYLIIIPHKGFTSNPSNIKQVILGGPIKHNQNKTSFTLFCFLHSRYRGGGKFNEKQKHKLNFLWH